MLRELVREILRYIYIQCHSCREHMRTTKEYSRKDEFVKGVWVEYRDGICRICKHPITLWQVRGARTWGVL